MEPANIESRQTMLSHITWLIAVDCSQEDVMYASIAVQSDTEPVKYRRTTQEDRAQRKKDDPIATRWNSAMRSRYPNAMNSPVGNIIQSFPAIGVPHTPVPVVSHPV